MLSYFPHPPNLYRHHHPHTSRAAYLLPLFRQLLDQRPLAAGEGPRALIFAPSRELVTQIHAEAKRLARTLGMVSTAIYGGASIAEQIADLKRGVDVVVATPGRLIELLTMRDGRLLSLARVTYVVLDEADRMFDMGFEPQVRGRRWGLDT
jgi:ATP-dependent RNA helicase DDX46/PRP5